MVCGLDLFYLMETVANYSKTKATGYKDRIGYSWEAGLEIIIHLLFIGFRFLNKEPQYC